MNIQKYKSQYTSDELETALDVSAELEVSGIKDDAVDADLYFRMVINDGTDDTFSWDKIQEVVPPVLPALANADDSLLADSEGNVLIPN